MRQDLLLRPVAKELGWTEKLDIRDEARAIPNYPIAFTKGIKTLWYSETWICADLAERDNGDMLAEYYCNHRHYPNLAEGLKKES